MDEKKFRCLFNDNAMATEKTSEGIRKFAAKYREAGEMRREQAGVEGAVHRNRPGD